MSLEGVICSKIYENLGFDESANYAGFDKLKKSIWLLHNEYLLGSCKEAGFFIKKLNEKQILNIFDFVMAIYNKRIKSHHSLFLFIHIFEAAIRSQIAKILYLNKGESCFLNDAWLFAKASRAKKANKSELNLQEANIFEILDLFTLGDLENIIDRFWGDFKPIFADQKEYKNQSLPSYGTKAHLLNTFSRIRRARNDIFHNHPPKIKQKSIIVNIEILLLRLDFNLQSAFFGISNLGHEIKLKYEYLEQK